VPKVVGNLNGHPIDIDMPIVSMIVSRYMGAVAGVKSLASTWFSLFHAWQERASGE
jgi:hypothetical protein